MRVDEVEFSDSLEDGSKEKSWAEAMRDKINSMIKEAIDKHEMEYHEISIPKHLRRKP